MANIKVALCPWAMQTCKRKGKEVCPRPSSKDPVKWKRQALECAKCLYSGAGLTPKEYHRRQADDYRMNIIKAVHE